MRLHDLGEGGLIQRIRNRFQNSGAILGIGDDAALLDIPPECSVVYCSDLMAEDTHFIRDLHPADSIGYKAVAVNASDIGAMGGIPMHFTVSLAAPDNLEVAWIDGFYDGVEKASRDFGVSLVGGDSSSAKSIFVDISMIGRVRRGAAVRRSGARPGDAIYVTGSLGASLEGLELLRNGNRTDPAVRRHLYPQSRHRIGAAVADRAHAMIDISDGLSTDLGHVVSESGVSARIYRDRLPASPGANGANVLHGGEEYELLIAASHLDGIIEGVPLTHIGDIIESAGEHQVFLVEDGHEHILRPEGWKHF